MDQLPIPLLRLIDSHLDLFDHFAFIAVCKRTYRLKINYRDSWIEFKKEIYNFDLRFLKYLIRYHQFSDVQFICIGNIECVKFFIAEMNIDVNDGLYQACMSGNIEIVNLMIQKGANDWNVGLQHACASGNIEIVQLMIHHGADAWNVGLRDACKSGNIEIVRLMIQKGANHWNGGLYSACCRGNLKIANLMIQKGAIICLYCNGENHRF